MLLVLTAIFAPLLAPYPPNETNPVDYLRPPSLEHPFGTDELGRDILSRTIYGSRVSLQVVAISITLSVVAGAAIGLVSGYFGGWWDEGIMRVMDALLAFPVLILALAIVAILGPSLTNAMIAIAVVNVPGFARLVRGEVLSLRTMEYVQAARSIGASAPSIIMRHVWPNVFGTLIVYASLKASVAIITEASLSFLGLGVQPPTSSWGQMVSVGIDYIGSAWWMNVFPGLAIFVTVLALNFFGDALRDALDVRLDVRGGGG